MSLHPYVAEHALDLRAQPPRSPRVRIAGFALLARALDKCRAYLAGTCGEYSHGCPVDMILLDAKRIELADFRAKVAEGLSDEQIGEWFMATGKDMSPEEIQEWSDALESRGFFERMEASDAEDFPQQ